MLKQKKSVAFSKLAQFNADERAKALRRQPNMINLLTPTEIALLFPDYYKRGTPDVGGYRAAVSRATAGGGAGGRQDSGGSSGRGGGGSGVGGAGVPNIDNMTPQERNFLGLVLRYESGNRNVPNYINDRTHTAQGYYQLTNTNWRNLAPKLGITASSAMEATKEEQTRVALALLRQSGQGNWTNYNPALRDAVSRGEVSAYDVPTPSEASSSQQNAAQRALQGATPSQGSGGSTTPGAPSTGAHFEGASFDIKDGYMIPKNDNLYDARNSRQCATLAKAALPELGRTSGWSITHDRPLRKGNVIATEQYNNGGHDRTGAGYHTGVLMSDPDANGNAPLLHQHNDSGGAKITMINVNAWPIGNTGKFTKFGLISSGGKVHDEVATSALEYGSSIASPEQRSMIEGKASSGGNTPGTTGSVTTSSDGQVTGGQTQTSTGSPMEQGQSASLMQPMQMMQSIMGMVGGGDTASPMGIISTMMPLIGSIAGQMLTGEGMGDAPSRRKRTSDLTTMPADIAQDYMRRVAIEREAKNLGIDPHHLATAMLFESIGSLNPDRKGVVDRRKGAGAAVKKGAQNKFMGLIQFGANEQLRYGVKPGMSFDEQMVSVGKYLKDKGLVRWMQQNPNAT
ncbi:hypothetical protein EB001_15255, partial [bacterium]|nr:hypothetical protein [bacterium]